MKNKSGLKIRVINIIKTAYNNLDIIKEILEQEKCEEGYDVRSVEDKQEYLKGLEYKLKIGYEEWDFITKELLESLYINRRYICSLMGTLDHRNKLLVAAAKVYYTTKGRCTVAPITFCTIKKKFKLYSYKKIININEINTYRLEKINASNNNLIADIEIIIDKFNVLTQ